MTKQDFINLILDEIESETKATPDTQLMDIDMWDSMASMITIGLALEHFNVKLTAPQLDDCICFDDILNLICPLAKILSIGRNNSVSILVGIMEILCNAFGYLDI